MSNCYLFDVVKDNVFQCVVENQFRDKICETSDLIITYVDNTVTSPPMGR